jgi:hypothetical protein
MPFCSEGLLSHIPPLLHNYLLIAPNAWDSRAIKTESSYRLKLLFKILYSRSAFWLLPSFFRSFTPQSFHIMEDFPNLFIVNLNLFLLDF